MEKQYLPSRLEELANRSIEIIEAPLDFRAYSVADREGNITGKVADLLFDIESKKVRYLVISLNSTTDDLTREVLAPVGLAEIDEEAKSVKLSALSPELIEALPDYMPGEVNPGVENIIRLAYSREQEALGLTANDTLAEEDHFYNHFHFDLSRIFANKRIEEVKKVSAVFDDSLEAETAVSDLLMHGFTQENIEVSAKKDQENLQEDTEARPSAGAVVDVITRNSEEALKASEILDKNGSINVYEGLN